MQTFRFFNNVGGINQQRNELALESHDAEEIINLHANEQGSWSNRDIGYVQINAAAMASGQKVHSVYQYQMLTGQSFLVSAAGGSLYTVEAAAGTTAQIASGLSSLKPMQFVTFNGLLIACNGVDAPKKWDGVNALTPLLGWPPVIAGVTIGKPAFAEIYANRLVMSGDEQNPSMLFISEQENPENFTPSNGVTSAGALQVSPGDGERITALKSLFLPLSNEEVLVIFKERSTYILSGSDTESFALQKISDEFGAVNHRCVLQVGSGLMFLSNEGITNLSTATMQGNLVTGFLSDRIRTQFESLNAAYKSSSFAIHVRQKKEIWWFVPEGSSEKNNLVLVYNYGLNGAWSKRTGVAAASGTITSDGLLFTGNYQGFLHQQMRGNSYQAQPIPWQYRTSFEDFSSPRQRKRIRDIELFLKQISNLEFTVNMFWDFQKSSSQRQTRVLKVKPDRASCVYGSTHYGEDQYAQEGSSVLRFTPNGSGRYFQMEFKGESLNKPIELEGWTVTVMQGGLR